MSAQILGVLIPVASIAGWYIHGIFSEKFQTQRQIAGSSDARLKEMLASNMDLQRKFESKLESIEARLDAIEKMLKDIPF